MTTVQSISQIVKDLALDYKLTQVEALTIAVQIQRNQILENGLVVSRSDSDPTGLEAIASCLGYDKDSSITLSSNISDIADSLNEIKEMYSEYRQGI